MTYFEFLSACGDHLVDPEIALDSEKIREALLNDSFDDLLDALTDEV